MPLNWYWKAWSWKVMKAETWMVLGGKALPPEPHSEICKLWMPLWVGDAESSTGTRLLQCMEEPLRWMGLFHGDLHVPWARVSLLLLCWCLDCLESSRAMTQSDRGEECKTWPRHLHRRIGAQNHSFCCTKEITESYLICTNTLGWSIQRIWK